MKNTTAFTIRFSFLVCYEKVSKTEFKYYVNEAHQRVTDKMKLLVYGGIIG
jgi:hypothetical protein